MKNSTKKTLHPIDSIEDDGFKRAISSDELIKQITIEQYVKQLRELVSVPEEHFHLFYLDPIKNLLEITQHCDTKIIHKRFEAIIKGLKLRRSLILPMGVGSENINRKKDLWTYTVFSILMLHNLSVEVLESRIMYKRTNTSEPQIWCPLNTPLEPPFAYQVSKKCKAPQYSAPVFLNVIFNHSCIAWLYQDEDAFNVLFELITSPDSSSPLGKLIDDAFFNKADVFISQPKEKVAIDVEEPEPTTTENSSFLDWLRNEIQTGDTKNEFILKTNNGIAIMDPDIFRSFATLHNVENWQTIRTQFLQLGIHKENSDKNNPNFKMTIPKKGEKSVILLKPNTIERIAYT